MTMIDTVPAITQEILTKASEALERARAALLDATLEVQKWETFIREYSRSHD